MIPKFECTAIRHYLYEGQSVFVDRRSTLIAHRPRLYLQGLALHLQETQK